MRVAYFVAAFPPRYETFIVNQLVGMLEQGVEIDIFASRRGECGEHVVASARTEELLARTTYRRQVAATRTGRVMQAAALFAKHFCRQPRAVLRVCAQAGRGDRLGVARILAECDAFLPPRRYDVIHCQYGPLGAVAVLLRYLGVLEGKIVTAFRGFDLTRTVQRREIDYSQLFAEGDLFLPVCESFRKRLIDLGCPAEKIAVHRSAVDCGKFPFRPPRKAPDEPLRLITVGRLYEKKGIEYAIRAVAELARDGQAVEYRIIGEGPLQAELERLIDELNLLGRVHLVGWLPPERVLEELQQAHIKLHPSVTSANGDEEGIPNSLKEAMACGLPVVATRHSGIPELVEDGVSGFLVPERDSRALADALRRLLGESDRWDAMGRAGRATVEHDYDARRLHGELLAHYRRLANPSSSSAADVRQPLPASV